MKIARENALNREEALAGVFLAREEALAKVPDAIKHLSEAEQLVERDKLFDVRPEIDRVQKLVQG